MKKKMYFLQILSLIFSWLNDNVVILQKIAMHAQLSELLFGETEALVNNGMNI